MRVAVTGGTGFLGRYVIGHLLDRGDDCRCWHRPESDRAGFEEDVNRIAWVPGDLSDAASMDALVTGCDAVVHSALYRPGKGFRGSEGDMATFVERNVLGTVRLIEAARRADVGRFVFISTCAVHEVILDDRKLDEAHPTWATTHYGAHKAAIEQFVCSYGLGEGYAVCALRPTGIYGLARPVERSRWYDLVGSVAKGEPIATTAGGKEVHAADVAKAVGILLEADGIAGQVYNCYDRYVSQQEVAEIARRISGSSSRIEPLKKTPKHEIDTTKLRALGMTFGGTPLLEETIEKMMRRAGILNE